MATGPHTWAFSRDMAADTQVYGGAGRAYPVGHEWIHDLRRSPLRFAFDEAQGRRATDELIADALGMAAAAGLLDPSRTRAQRRRATGVVKGFAHPERALFDIDRTLVTVIPGLVSAGVPLERMLTKGMPVEGWYDPDGVRLDLRESLLPADESLATYVVGDVVLARVAEVGPTTARLELHPSVVVEVTHDDVTPNDLDTLDSLMSPGEVVAARITAAGPAWGLYLADVDDDEPVTPAVALLPGGPPWLEPPPEPARASNDLASAERAEFAEPGAVVARIDLVEPADVAETFAREPEAVALAPEVVALAPEVVAPEPDAIPSRAPTPAILDRKKAQQVPAVPAPDQADPEIAARSATNQLRLTVDTLRVELRTTKARVDQLESEHAALLNERNTLTRLHAEQQRELTRAQDELARLRTRLRRASKAPHSTTRVLPRFADRERAIRYAVETAWAERTPVGEQLESPLPSFRIGPDFLDSVEELSGVTIDKIADVVFEVVTGRADQSPGRAVRAPLLRRRHLLAGRPPTRHTTGSSAALLAPRQPRDRAVPRRQARRHAPLRGSAT